MGDIVAIMDAVLVGVAGRHAIAAVVEDAAHQDGGGVKSRLNYLALPRPGYDDYVITPRRSPTGLPAAWGLGWTSDQDRGSRIDCRTEAFPLFSILRALSCAAS